MEPVDLGRPPLQQVTRQGQIVDDAPNACTASELPAQDPKSLGFRRESRLVAQLR